MPSVRFEQITKVYPDSTRALSDIDFRVEDGELVAVMGPSGCGKTTLLRVLAGLEDATGGRLWIGDRMVNDVPAQRRNVAMVFQDYALYPHLSVRGNLEFPLLMHGSARAERRQRVHRVADMLELVPHLDRLPRQLSGGQRQRVAMGRALVRESDVMLLDEPLSNLDARLRVQMREQINEIRNRTGTTMIYVTHDQSEAMTLGDRVAVLHQGRLQQLAAAKDLYARPANLIVAGFVGNPPMNLFAAKLESDAAGAMWLAMDGHHLHLGDIPNSNRLRTHVGQSLTAGVRPEHVRLADGPSRSDALPANVRLVEYLGHEMLVHARMGDDVPMVARLPGTTRIAIGECIHLLLPASHLCLFDADGRAIEDGRR